MKLAPVPWWTSEWPIDPLFQPPTMFPLSTALPRNQQQTLPSTTDPPTAVRVVPTTKSSCPSGKFQCRDGQCIDANWRCDRYDDCRDMSDEQNCPCRSNQMTCANGVCVNKIWICDGSDDCGDNSDEKNCSVPTSSPCKERTIILLRGWGESSVNCQNKYPVEQKLLKKAIVIIVEKYFYTPPLKIMHNIKMRIKFHAPEMPLENKCSFFIKWIL